MILSLLFLISCQTKELTKQPTHLPGEGERCDANIACDKGFSCWNLPNDNVSGPVCVSDAKYPSSKDLCEILWKKCRMYGFTILSSVFSLW